MDRQAAVECFDNSPLFLSRKNVNARAYALKDKYKGGKCLLIMNNSGKTLLQFRDLVQPHLPLVIDARSFRVQFFRCPVKEPERSLPCVIFKRRTVPKLTF